jgi:hypothetical protein
METYIIARVRTESENSLVQNFLFHNGYKWNGNTPFFTIQDMYGKESCLFASEQSNYLTYASRPYCKREGLRVLEIPEFCSAIQKHLEKSR